MLTFYSVVPIIASFFVVASFCSDSNSSLDSELSDFDLQIEGSAQRERRRFRCRLSKERRQKLFMLGPFAEINNDETLRRFLVENSNVYNNKVLSMLDRKNVQPGQFDEIHHIIPKSAGGPDNFWNLIAVSFDEHKELHYLRFEAYGEKGDLIAARSRDGDFSFTKEEKTAAAKRGHATMKKLGIGFYDSNLQSELGVRNTALSQTPNRKKGYVAQASTKGSVYLQLFEHPLLFTFTEHNLLRIVKTQSNYFTRSGEIKAFLLKHTPKNSKAFKKIQNDKYCSTNLNKVLQNLLPELGIEAKGNRPTYKGWRVSFWDGNE